MTISGTLTTSPRCLPNQGKLLQKESMVNQSHDSGVDSMNTNSSGNQKKNICTYLYIFRGLFYLFKSFCSLEFHIQNLIKKVQNYHFQKEFSKVESTCFPNDNRQCDLLMKRPFNKICPVWQKQKGLKGFKTQFKERKGTG